MSTKTNKTLSDLGSSLHPLSMNILSTALILLDQHFNIRQINSAAEQLLGFSARQIEQGSFFDLVKGELTPSLLQTFIDQQQSGFIEEIELKVAIGIVKTNLMATPCSVVSDNDLLLELQSSTHQQNIRKDIQIQQQSRVSEHLIRNLAHEIKNPLGGIKGAAQLLERKLPAGFSNQYSQIIIRESDRLSALVDRLLMPATPEAAQWVNPHLLIEQALEVVILQIKNKIIINKDYDPSLPEIKVSQNQILQALLNLIKNAAEALFPNENINSKNSSNSSKNKRKNNSVVPTLTLRTRMMHQHAIGQSQYRQVLRIDIQDNGSGINKELVNDIFFPTISGKESSGLGLSIAQSLVQRHQGIIELESHSEPTIFSLYLPMLRSSL